MSFLGSAAAKVIHIDELDAVRKLARSDWRMTAVLCGVQLIGYHDFHDVGSWSKFMATSMITTEVTHE